jgi:hypothetical protein
MNFKKMTEKDLKNQYFGGSEKAIKAAFECASKAATKVMKESGNPNLQVLSILFLDELDSLAPDRRSGDKLASTTVNALLQAMDGISSSPNVVVIGICHPLINIDRCEQLSLDTRSSILAAIRHEHICSSSYCSRLTILNHDFSEAEQLLHTKMNKMIRKSMKKFAYDGIPRRTKTEIKEVTECSPSQVREI